MKQQFILMIFILLYQVSFGQKEKIDAIIFRSNGETIHGKVNPDFAARQDIKVYVGKKVKTIQKRKIDSIQTDAGNYFMEKTFFDPYILKPIETGRVNLYEVNGKVLGIKREDSELYIIPKNKYGCAYQLFCLPVKERIDLNLNEKEFIEKIRENNNSAQNNPVLLDSIRGSKQGFQSRISFFRPEAGLEISISDKLTIYNSIGMNFWGNYFRGAQTIINYDYSGEIRYFYNQDKRFNQGKSCYNFSGPFLAGTYKYFMETNRDNQPFIGFLHGWQDNNVFKSLYSSYRIGAGFSLDNGNFFIMSFLSMGWSF